MSAPASGRKSKSHPESPLETNAAFVARPLVGFDKTDAGNVVSSAARGQANAIESLRAYLDAQNAGAWHKTFTDGKTGAIGLALLLTLIALAVVWIRYPHKDEEVAYFESVQSTATDT